MKNLKISLVLSSPKLALALLTCTPSLAIGRTAPVTTKQAMVVAAEPLAAKVGVAILKKGGNAFDAAVAVGFAMAVTFQEAGNLGGGGFCVGLTKRGKPLALDFRETAPAAASRNMFLDSKGDVIPNKSLRTLAGAGVPGTVDGLVELRKKYGKLTLREDMTPAILLARGGFPTPTGLVYRQPDLADALQRIAEKGRNGFYQGKTARLLTKEMARHGGLITAQDLRGYHAKWRKPFTIDFDGYHLITMPPPSSGGVTIAQVLGLIDVASLKADGLNTPKYIHDVVEAERLAFADRNKFLGDPDFVKIPLAQLTSQPYLEERKRLIPADKAGVSAGISNGNPEKKETTHYCVVDKDGNAVAITYTLNGPYGLGRIVPGTGFVLNDEMDDFTSKPGAPNMFELVQGEANAIQPGKRMLSSMTPLVVTRNGHFFETIGSPGGATIATTVLQTFLDTALFGMNIRDAVDAGRFHHQWLPDVVDYDYDNISEETLATLQAMGYKVKPVSLGRVNAIQRVPDGTLAGWSDRRGEGLAVGY